MYTGCKRGLQQHLGEAGHSVEVLGELGLDYVCVFTLLTKLYTHNRHL